VNKATIKPESMRVINEIVNLMKVYPELKFSVEGHTDSDGNPESNQ
jgi:OmpA-OmpF porin, OOP family